MHDIRWIRENPQEMAAGLAKRGISPDEAKRQVDGLIARDEARRAHVASLQEMQERRNYLSKEIGAAMRDKDMARAEELKAEVARIKAVIQEGEGKERGFDDELRDALAGIPNLPLPDVPVGRDERDNVEIRTVGEKPRMNFQPKEHFEIGEALGMMDFETAARLSGARFTVLKGKLARLERALGQFMLDLHTTEFGYTEVQPPVLVRDDALYGTGQLPKFEEDLFGTTGAGSREDVHDELVSFLSERGVATADALDERDLEKMISRLHGRLVRGGRLYLIPTAEVPLTNLVRESIVAEDQLPLRFTALTPCFRSEAGSAGRDTRGMLRQHQFDKVELVSITTPEQSADEHERMLSCAEEVLKRLGLHYRVMTLSTGDMGFGAQKTYDIEVWLPGQDTYREISSCSVCGDFQARRMDARFKDKAGKIRPVHTLNGSALAVGRTLIAVIENYQQADGTIAVPEALRRYMGGLEVIAK